MSDDVYKVDEKMARMFQPHESGYISEDVEMQEEMSVRDLLPCPVCGECTTDDEEAPCLDCEGTEDARAYVEQTVDDIFDTRDERDGR